MLFGCFSDSRVQKVPAVENELLCVVCNLISTHRSATTEDYYQEKAFYLITNKDSKVVFLPFLSEPYPTQLPAVGDAHTVTTL